MTHKWGYVRARAHYTFKMYTDSYPYPTLIIYDQGGKVSVTNDIENVLSEISSLAEIDLKGFMIIYRDEEEVFDGYCLENQDFVIFNELTEEGAIIAFTDLLNRRKKEIIVNDE